MIEDKELSDLFKVESEEHVSQIEDGLLVIEKDPGDLETMHTIFREAHSLKGAARMLGVNDVETIAHIMEEMLGKASRGEARVTPEQIDRIYMALDSVKKLVDEAVTGEEANVDILYVIDVLNGTQSMDRKGSAPKPVPHVKAPSAPKQAEPKKTDIPPPSPTRQEESTQPLPQTEIKQEQLDEKLEQLPETKTSEPVVAAEEEVTPPPKPDLPKPKTQLPTTKNPKTDTSQDKYKIDTMRVDSGKLDALMVQTGELIVTKLRIARRLKDITDIQLHLEDIQKINFESKKILKEFEDLEKKGRIQRSIISRLQGIFNDNREKLEVMENLLGNLQKTSSNDSAKLDLIAGKIEDGIQKIRMLPLSSVFSLFNRTVRDLCRTTGKEINLVTEGGNITADKQIIEDLKDPLMHLVRNAIDHGIEAPAERIAKSKDPTATLKLIGKSLNNMVVIEISDDGRGLDAEKIKQKAIEKGLFSIEELNAMDNQKIFFIIFMHGFSTRAQVDALSGRGVGMDVVKTFVDNMKGNIEISSTPNQGTTFTLRLPIRFSTTHVLIIEVDKRHYAIPIDYVVLSKMIQPSEVYTIEGKNTVTIGNEPVSVIFLKDYLEIETTQTSSLDSPRPCITISDGNKKVGIIVDNILDKQEVIMKPLGGVLQRVRNVSGGTILESGNVCIILNPKDLIQSIIKKKIYFEITAEEEVKQPTILIAEDSPTIATQIKRILETNGYTVSLAVDGEDAHKQLMERNYSLLLTDIEMPNMDGLTLTRILRKSEKYKDLPIVVLTSLGSAGNIKAGMDAGASAYLVKSSFNQFELIQTIKRFM